MKAEGQWHQWGAKALTPPSHGCGDYLTDEYALWLEFRTIYKKCLTRGIRSTGGGITLQIEKKAETAGVFKAYICLFMDAQLMTTFRMERSPLPCIRKVLCMMEPHTALLLALAGIGKTHLALDLPKREYFNHFDFIIILWPTLWHNETYHQWKWFWNDPDISQIVLGDSLGNYLYGWIKKLGAFLAGHKTLLLIDDIIADEMLDKQRQLFLGLAISGRHKSHLLWLLTQSYTVVPMNIWRWASIWRSEDTGIWFMKRTMSSKHQRK